MKPQEKEPEFLSIEWFRGLDREEQQFHYSMLLLNRNGGAWICWVPDERLSQFAEVMGEDTPRNVRVEHHSNSLNITFDNPVKELKK